MRTCVLSSNELRFPSVAMSPCPSSFLVIAMGIFLGSVLPKLQNRTIELPGSFPLPSSPFFLFSN